jgi:AraC-like DNA-binding protein
MVRLRRSVLPALVLTALAATPAPADPEGDTGLTMSGTFQATVLTCPTLSSGLNWDLHLQGGMHVKYGGQVAPAGQVTATLDLSGTYLGMHGLAFGKDGSGTYTVRTDAVLGSQPHTYSADLCEPGATSTSAALRRARRFCEEHAAEPITLRDIATAARVSVRTLQSGFREHLRTTPMAYLREVRLARAHADLLHIAATGSPTTVTEVALRWGFVHLGRFAAFYRQTYGHAPSVTRRGRE